MSIETMTNIAYWSALLLPGISAFCLLSIDVDGWTTFKDVRYSFLGNGILHGVLCLALLLLILGTAHSLHLPVSLWLTFLLICISTFLGLSVFFGVNRTQLRWL